MSREYAKVAIGAWKLDLVHLLGNERAFGRDDLEGQFSRECHEPVYADAIALAFSTASSIPPTM